MKKTLCFIMAIIFVLSLVPVTAQASTVVRGEFTAAFINVDGLPSRISAYRVNSNCPGTSGTELMGSKIAANGWDIVGIAEDFNYHSSLVSGLGGYSVGTWRGKVSSASGNNTDGLNLAATGSILAESWTRWTSNSSTSSTADKIAKLGYRFYQVETTQGLTVDVYVYELDIGTTRNDKNARSAQLTALANAIKASDNGNPIIVMGDANSTYSEGLFQSKLIDAVNSDARFTAKDACKELGVAEGDNKIVYINNTESEVSLFAENFRNANEFVNSRGTALADSYPVVVNFIYTVEVSEETHEHSYIETMRLDPTCTENGAVEYMCECGDGYTELLPALGHSYAAAAYIEPNCTREGCTVYSCVRCGDSFNADYTGYDVHSLELTDSIAPTCTEEGLRVYTCTVCGAEETETVPALGHDYVITGTTASSCTEPGSVTMGCTRCGDSYSEASEIAGHVYSAVIVEPTCEEVGYTVYTCQVCGESEIGAFTAAYGHVYENGICTACGAGDPDYVAPAEPDSTVYTLGGNIDTFTDGMSIRVYQSYNGSVVALGHNGAGDTVPVFVNDEVGGQIDPSTVWKVTAASGGYTLSFEEDGVTYYLGRTGVVTSGGLTTKVSTTPFSFYIVKSISKPGQVMLKVKVGSSAYSIQYNGAEFIIMPSGKYVQIAEVFEN